VPSYVPLEVFANNATTTVSSGGTTAPTSGTQETWTVASSASFPVVETGAQQFHVADPALGSEMVTVVNVSGTTWTVIRGAEELRVKESDRIAQMAQGLRAMGADVEELPDGLRIRGGRKLHGAEIDSAHDHRIALAFSVAALAADSPTTVSGAEWADVSFPGFYDLLRRLGAEVELQS